MQIGRFTIGFRKTNRNGRTEEREIPFKVKTTKLPKARENAGNQVTIGFIYASDWSRWRREFSRPITH